MNNDHVPAEGSENTAPDRETHAMGVAYAALAELDYAAQIRALRWLRAKLDIWP